jgi:molybdopterin synthase catalytic subunit
MSTLIRIQREDFDPQAESDALTKGRKDVGALATFTGFCRDEGGVLSALELEHYPGMAEKELQRIADEARARWPVQGIIIIHRFGKIEPSERIVFVAVSGGHRGEAFAACEYIMDFLKTSAPFWKREHKVDGTSGTWVEAKDADDQALEKWT